MPGWCIRSDFEDQGTGGKAMQRLTVGSLILFAFCVPWEYSLDLGEPFGNSARIVGILLLLTAVPWVLTRREIRRPEWVQWLVLAFYLYFACTYFWTVDHEATLEKIRSYFQVMMAVWLIWELAETPAHLQALLRAFVAGCWVLAALTLVDFSSASAVAAGQIRFVASGQDPNDVARFLDLGFPLAALLFSTERQRWCRLLAILYVPAGLSSVLLTASRGGFSAAIAALFGAAVLLVMARPRAASVVFVALALMAGALWLFVPVESLDRLATIPQEVGSGDWNDRLNIWDAGWRAFEQSPLWGSGAGTFTTASGLAPGDTAHNTVMAVLVTGGLLGAAIFAAIVAAVGFAVARTEGLMRVALGTTLAVWAITSMVGSVEENRATWLLFGIMALAERLSRRQPGPMAALFSGFEPSQIGARAYAGR
jgi:O-antigen ligase